jgi:hypothetical protein
MTGANEGRVPEQPRTEFAQLQVLFDLANAVSRAQNQSEICHFAVLRLVPAIAADQAAVLIIATDDVIVSRRGWTSQASIGPPWNSTHRGTEVLATAVTTNRQRKSYLSVSVSPP